jgi:hypothetical protein
VDAVDTPDEKLAAALHDLLEDTLMTADGLRDAGCPPQVVAAVQALTRRPGEDYEARAVRDPIPRIRRGSTRSTSYPPPVTVTWSPHTLARAGQGCPGGQASPPALVTVA